MNFRLFFIFILLNTFSYSQTQTAKYKIGFINQNAKEDLKEKLISKNQKNILIYNRFIRNSEPAYGYLIYNNKQSTYQLENKLQTDDKKIFNFIYNKAGGNSKYFNGFKQFYQTDVTGEESFVYMDKIDWQIKPDKTTINGIKCQLATFNKNEDKVVKVWFSLEHHVPFGPQYYYGLPGLIVRIEDKPFLTQLIEINKTNKNIESFPENIKILTLEEFKSQNNFNDFFKN